MPVREQLLQLRRRFHSRADEVKAAKAAVERETLADAGAIVERLRSVEALKQVNAMVTITPSITPQNVSVVGAYLFSAVKCRVRALCAGGGVMVETLKQVR